jgi:hypothetical protein
MDGFRNQYDQFKEFTKENSKYLIEILNMMAKNNRTYYELLIQNGFTEEQAFELLKHQRFLGPGR